MPDNLVAEASIEVKAPPMRVWKALTEPAQVRQYYFGTDLQTDWEVGSPMTFTGEWEGKPYEDLGTVEEFEPHRRLAYSHWSPMSGTEDTPENRHHLAFDLELLDDGTLVTITQGNNESEEVRARSQEMWESLLGGLKELVERPPTPTEPTLPAEPQTEAEGESQPES